MTVTVKEQVLGLPAWSVKVYVTTVAPTKKNVLGCLLTVTEGSWLELSTAVGAMNVMIVPPELRGVVSVMSTGQFSTIGSVVSSV